MEAGTSKSPTSAKSTKKSPKTAKKMQNPKEMSKEELKAALLKKRECEDRALKIVLRLIENPVPAQWFVYSLRFISLNHLEDIIEERSIVKQCGYPICNGVIKISPKQQFSISTRNNKVYDITERKKFCTDKCYKAAIFVKEQMLTSPLWMRDKEEIPEFKLLPWEITGLPGMEIEFGVSKLDIEPPKFTSVSEFCESSISDELPDTFEEIQQPGSFLEHTEEPKRPPVRKVAKAKPKTDPVPEVRINRKIIESKFAELINEDEQFKLSKHQLKMLNISDKNHKDESLKMSIESLKERLEKRRQAMEKESKRLKTVTEAVADLKLNDTKTDIIETKSEETVKDSVSSEAQLDLIAKSEPCNKDSKIAELNYHELSGSSNLKTKIQTKEDVVGSSDIDPQTTGLRETVEISTVPTLNSVAERDSVGEKAADLKPISIHNESNGPSAKSIAEAKQITLTTKLAIKHVETCLIEWFTIDSLIFIYGEDSVKKDLAKHSQNVQEILAKAIADSKNLHLNEAYKQLCKKIDLLEIEENRQDSIIINKNLRPLPDYRMLRADNKRLLVKVRSFYQGCMEIEEPDLNSESEVDSDDDEEKEEEEEEERVQVPLIPSVDKNGQNVLRRRIVFNCLNRIMPGLLQTFGLTSHDMGTEIRQLIGTFHLTAKNIIFKPIHLNLIGLIVIKILAEKNRGLCKLLEENTAVKYTNLLLGIYKLPSGYVNEFVTNLVKIENIVKVHCKVES